MANLAKWVDGRGHKVTSSGRLLFNPRYLAPMATISYVVARAQNDIIGCDNRLPWHLNADLQRFKKITSDHVVIMGRKTYESIGKPLPNRFNIIISRHFDVKLERVYVAPDPISAILMGDMISQYLGKREMFVIGGDYIFNLLKDFAERIYLTEVEADVSGDAYFKMRFSKNDWKTTSVEHLKMDNKNEYDTSFYLLNRRKGPRKNSRIKLNSQNNLELF